MTKRGGFNVFNVFNGGEWNTSEKFTPPTEDYRVHVWPLTADQVEELRKLVAEKFGPKARISITGLNKNLGKPTYRSIDEEERELRADE